MAVHKFGVYYGYGPLAGLEQFDAAVLEPEGWQDRDLGYLQARGVQLLAYVSLLEVNTAVRSKVFLESSDLLTIEGGVWTTPEENVVVDPRSRRWRTYLREHIRDLHRRGYDGIFLDTVGDVEDERAAPLTGWLCPTLADLIGETTTPFRGRPVIQNNGIFLLLPLTLSVVSGICWETDWRVGMDRSVPVQMAMDQLLMAERARIRPWLLSQIPDHDRDALADWSWFVGRLAYPSYSAPSDYVHGVRLPDGRIVEGHAVPPGQTR